MLRFREILRRLKDGEVEFVIIGGVAAGLLGSPMATLDVDVCAPLDDTNLGRIIEALRGLNPRWRFRPDKMIPVDDVARFRGCKNLYILRHPRRPRRTPRRLLLRGAARKGGADGRWRLHVPRNR